MAFPKNSSEVQVEVERILAHFAGRLGDECLVIGNGPSAATPHISAAEVDRAVVLRANWFFLEKEQTYGRRVDGFFWSVDNAGLRTELEKRMQAGTYDVRGIFQPFIASDNPDAVVDPTAKTLAPNFDHWAVLAGNPTLARFFMGRPLPTQGMQMIAFAAALGFKRVRVAGIDLYEAAAQRYAWDVPDDIKKHLQKKDYSLGYEQRHSLERDLMFLRAVRTQYDFELIGISRMHRLAPLLDRIEPAPPPEATVRPSEVRSLPPRVFVTLADGEYAIGAIALARSLASVSAHPLLVLHSDPSTPGMLRHLDNVICRAVDVVPNPHAHGKERYAATFTKLRIFELLECDRVVYVDADAVVQSSIDDLFERPEFCVAPDWGKKLTEDFNSGLLAFTPSRELAARVMSQLDRLGSKDGGDQGYLNNLLRGEVEFLPPEYNALKRVFVHHPDLVNPRQAKVIHFVGDKPWHLRSPERHYRALEREWAKHLHAEDWQLLYAWERDRATAEPSTRTGVGGLLGTTKARIRKLLPKALARRASR